jgi:hypothetical protein
MNHPLRNHPTRRRFLRAGLLLFFCANFAASGDETRPPKTVRLLTVGNSFSHNATHYLGELAKAAGDTLILHEANVGGASLELHWGKAVAFEKNPDDKNGLYAGGRSLKGELTSGKWDFITLQQASIKSHDVTTYRPFAGQLMDYIRQNAPGATVLLHETWEYRADDPRFAQKAAVAGEPATQDEMYQGLSGAYRAIARELGVRLLPVGDAFHLANHDPQWGYRASAKKFDPNKAKPGELPDQTHSLNVGWTWKKQADGKLKIGMDGHHANAAGEYLGACVWYEVMFGRSAEGNAFVPPGLDPAEAKYLQRTAHQAVAAATAEDR